eukprot:scaffold25694_cov127-Cylindrotheca_fusiformis.AAC.11
MTDPFSVFGSDSEDDASHIEDNEAAARAKFLVKEANAKSNTGPTPLPVSGLDVSNADLIDLSYLEKEELPWPSPLYQGDVAVFRVDSFGGGRGYCALKTLPPGTTILVETPAMEWTEEQLGKKLDISAIRCLLDHPNARKIVHWVEYFHPMKVVVDVGADVAADSEQQIWKMMDEQMSEYSDSEVTALVELAKDRGIVCENSTPISSTDVFRMLLCIRYNGLESGLYLHSAMLNHSCHPNCAKLLPEGKQSYSEVVTTREVRAGQSLTISYCPSIMSHASRRRYLYNHRKSILANMDHNCASLLRLILPSLSNVDRFDIGANLKGDSLRMELVNGNFPPSSVAHVDSDSITQRIETTLQELERTHFEYAAVVGANDLVTMDMWEIIKALELSVLELYGESKRQLVNDQHLLLISCLSLHLEVCDLVQRAPNLSTNVQLGILCRQVRSARTLAPLQVLFHGKDHFNLGRTHLDLANAIGELLSRSPKHLFALNLPALETFEQWSIVENLSRKEHKRIKALYANRGEVLLKQAM